MNPALTRTPDPPAQAPPTPPPAKSLDLDIIRSFRMHRALAIAVAAFVFLFVLYYGLSRRPYYEAQSLIYVQPAKTKVITEGSDNGYDAQRYETFVQQQLQTIIRADIMTEALSQPSTRQWRYPGETLKAASVRLASSLKIERIGDSYELGISLTGSEARSVAAVVNAVSEAYIRGERNDELAQSDQQLSILEDERTRVSADLENDRKQQVELSKGLGVADTSGDSANPYDVQLIDLRSELAKAVAAHDVASAEVEAINNAPANSPESIWPAAEEMATNDPGLQAFKTNMGERRSVLASQMAGLTPQNPLYKLDQEELQRMDNSLSSMESDVRGKSARQLKQKLVQESQRTAGIVDRLSRQLAEKTTVATGATPQLQRAEELHSDILRLQLRYNTVDNAINSIELEKSTPGLVHILVHAEPPGAPKTSAKRTIILASLPLGILMGLLAAVVAAKLDPRIYVGKDVRKLLQFHPITILPKMRAGDSRARNEFLLRLVAGIDQIHRSDDARTFVFTGASPELNVADLVASLARKMTRLGYRIEIVRAADLINGSAFTSDVVRLKDDEPASPEILGRPNESFVARNLEALKMSADVVFVESASLLSSSETEFACRLSDVVILVAGSGQTTRADLGTSVALIKRLRVPGLAVVLTDVDLRTADSGLIKAVRSAERRLNLDPIG